MPQIQTEMKRNKLIIYHLLLYLLINACSHKDPNNGIQEEYYPNGMLKSSMTLKDGQRNGIVKHFDTQGRLLSTAYYKNDVKEGELINYNSETKQIILKANFKNDVQHGEVIQYYREGMLFRKSNYNNGRVDGLVTTYWPDGKTKAENEFKNGKPAIGLKEFDKNEKLIIQPTLAVRNSNYRKNTLELSINGEFSEVEFYISDLEEGKYFNPKSKKLRNDDGKSYYDYTTSKKTYRLNKISIVAKVKTKYGNTLILNKITNI